MIFKTMRLRAFQLAFLSASALCVPAANAAIVYATGGATNSIPGLSGFATTGAMMDGLEVTAIFVNGQNTSTETVVWEATGPTSGDVLGAGWTLSVTGNTFSEPWVFTIDPSANLGRLRTLTLDARNALTVFDRSDNVRYPNGDSQGTPGSFSGQDWICSVGDCQDAIVTYDYAAYIPPATEIGDIWQTLEVSFFLPDPTSTEGQLIDFGPSADFQFFQDTDNDSSLNQTPEPGTLALLGVALGAIGFGRRRMRTRA